MGERVKHKWIFSGCQRKQKIQQHHSKRPVKIENRLSVVGVVSNHAVQLPLSFSSRTKMAYFARLSGKEFRS
jgi:hypothetical protein